MFLALGAMAPVDNFGFVDVVSTVVRGGETGRVADGAVDVVISNCVINLSVDKAQVLAEMYRVLTPGGRIGLSDVIAEDELTAGDRAERGSFVGCIAGALSRREYLDGLAAVGVLGAEVEFTHEAVPGMHGAIIRATKPQA